MQVKKRLRINIAVTVFTALVIVATLFLTASRIDDAIKGGEVADQIITTVFQRIVFRDDFVRNSDLEAQRRWIEKNDEVNRLLQSAVKSFKHPDDRETVSDLIRDNNEVALLFSKILQNRFAARRNPASSRRMQEVEARLLSEINVKAYRTVTDARRLQQASNEHVFLELRRAGLVLIVVIALVSAAASFNAWAMDRFITERFARLRQGSAIIGEGNLDYRIDMSGNDEFSELSLAFNSMTSRLRRLYLDLETEVGERKRTEHELRLSEERLRRSAEELEIRVEERTQELTLTLENLRRETEEKLRAMEELRNNERMLVQQSRMASMGEMIGNISHQWKQPLNMLGLIIQEIGFTYTEGQFSEEYLEASVEKAMQVITDMSATIDDFRDFFRPERRMQTFNINEALEKTILLLESDFKHLQVTVDIEVESECPIKGLRNEFSQVLLNILANARDVFRERQTEKPHLAIRIFCENNRSVITIEDNAGGIPEEIVDRIFDAYFTTKGPDKGTGIGLFMSKTIIEKNLNGKLTVRNTEKGAKFRIEV